MRGLILGIVGLAVAGGVATPAAAQNEGMGVLVRTIAKTRPNIDLEINFDYDSAVVGPQAVPVLVTLGHVLSKDEFKGIVFLINGHTDAKGSAEYNQGLSERRAEAVKRFLVQQFNRPSDTLIAIGYGKTQLKNTAEPLAAENRRVQIVNREVK